ncbi:MAG: hypothetical protein LV479_11915 [Methylacidiphilales bacterium]|nr:hypothetical protein [Candidatus Methylacidiphilales bacterium]
MGRIDEALQQIESIGDKTERALQLAGLLTTLFKIKGTMLVVTGQLAFDSYANAASDKVELEMAPLTGKLAPRMILEIMRGQLHARGVIYHWTAAGLPVHFLGQTEIVHPDLCRDFMTEHGVAKLLPAEEIAANCILSAVYPMPDFEAQTRARLLLINGLTDAFHMDWKVLHDLCHRFEYRVGEELAQMRLAAKKDVDAMGASPDPLAAQAPAPAVKAKIPRRPMFDDPNMPY